MSELQTTTTTSEVCDAIIFWLERKLDAKAMDWLTDRIERFKREFEEWEFFAAFSGASRHTGKDLLGLTKDDLKKAEMIRPGWRPDFWTMDEAARTLIVLSISNLESTKYLDLLDKTFDSSDIGEAVALYKSTAILPCPGQLRVRAAEGVRSNMTSVFKAVAHRNPYPADYFDDTAWNQMVLKALFVNIELYLIHDFDRRINKKLAGMLTDFAHERWAAGREISPELWRAVGPFAEGGILDDLKKELHHSDPIHRSAATLALSSSKSQKAEDILNAHIHLVKDKNNLGSWDEIGIAAGST